MHPYLISYSSDPDLTPKQLTENKNLQDRKITDRITQHNISGQRYEQQDFHYKFTTIVSPPKIYYSQGKTSLLNGPILGIVGPRKMSPYGQKIVNEILDIATQYQLSTISGLAPGTDQFVHQGSIQRDIPTIAVLGGGIKWFREHKSQKLLQQIVDQGLLISEYKLDFCPTKYSFPQRNRIIAGLADVILIPEAGQKSGSLITADFAYQMKKPSFGVSNSIFAENYQGLWEFLAQKKIGVCPPFGSLFKKYFFPKHHKPKTNTKNHNLSKPEKQILSLLHKHTQLNTEQFIQFAQTKTTELISTINLLEVKNLIRQISPGTFELKQ